MSLSILSSMTRPPAGHPAAEVAKPSPATLTAPVMLDTDTIFGAGRTEVRIRHRGQEYRLRITKQGKLILTK